MKNPLNFFLYILSSVTSFVFNTLIVILNPFFEIANQITREICKIIQNKSKIDTKAIIKILDNSERLVIASCIFYYILLVLMEIVLTLSILIGIIPLIDFELLVIITIFTILITIYLVHILNNKFKSKKFHIATYIQILYLLPLILAYWVANIEGHDIVLKNINADQWCNIFNSIIIYVSSCIIGFSGYFKK